ncbi:MAG: effector binding domain-containing protein [Chloroflexia bacterium]|jgi:predicted transcriptional regulator YdeE|nr:effector binding domain-containing protein [Chloroflexia bacterium]
MTSPEIIEVPALRAVGASIRTSNQAQIEAKPGQGPISTLWQTFTDLDVGKRVPNPHVSGEVVAIYHDYESDATGDYTLTIGLRVTSLHQVPKGLEGIEVPFQRYARFPVEGPPDTAIPGAWQAVQETDLDRACTFDLEIYQPDSTAEMVKAEILVALND